MTLWSLISLAHLLRTSSPLANASLVSRRSSFWPTSWCVFLLIVSHQYSPIVSDILDHTVGGYTHSQLIYCNIKPDHFLLGKGAHSNCISIIDFGLAKEFRDPNTYRHIPYTENNSLVGTARYCSINSHMGLESARHDDLESLAYVLLYFLHSSLPWQNLEASIKYNDYTPVLEKKTVNAH